MEKTKKIKAVKNAPNGDHFDAPQVLPNPSGQVSDEVMESVPDNVLNGVELNGAEDGDGGVHEAGGRNDRSFRLIHFENISIENNVRKSFDKASLEELSKSINEHGIIQPLLVQRLAEGRRTALNGVAIPYRLIAGHRRYQAARIAGFTVLPCMVIEDDNEHETDFLALQITENLQRESVTPIEEAIGFKHLRRTMTIARIARTLGKTPTYVAGRLALCDMGQEWIDALSNGQLPLASASLVARLPEDSRTMLWDKLSKDRPDWNVPGSSSKPDEHSVRIWIENSLMVRLADATWDLSLTIEGIVACNACPKRTGNNPLLFAEGEDTDICLSPACYQTKKTVANNARIQGEIDKNPGVVLITNSYMDTFWKERLVIGRSNYSQCDADDPDALPAVYAGDTWRRETNLYVKLDEQGKSGNGGSVPDTYRTGPASQKPVLSRTDIIRQNKIGAIAVQDALNDIMESFTVDNTRLFDVMLIERLASSGFSSMTFEKYAGFLGDLYSFEPPTFKSSERYNKMEGWIRENVERLQMRLIDKITLLLHVFAAGHANSDSAMFKIAGYVGTGKDKETYIRDAAQAIEQAVPTNRTVTIKKAKVKKEPKETTSHSPHENEGEDETVTIKNKTHGTGEDENIVDGKGNGDSGV